MFEDMGWSRFSVDLVNNAIRLLSIGASSSTRGKWAKNEIFNMESTNLI